MLYSSRFRFALAAAGAMIVAFSTPASAVQTAPRSTAPEPRSADADSEARSDADRIICVRARLTGSRLNRRICRTQREWDEDGGVPTGR